MAHSTWSDQRGLVFARGLYHIASCDGLARRERQALQVFLDKVGVPATVDDLAAEPFDYAEAARVFDSTWLRRVFVQACRLMVQIDGQVSATERDALRALALALGLGEQVALADITGPRPDVEQLVEWIGALSVDFVSWDDADKRAWFYRFPHPDHPLAVGADVRVCHGQVLVVRDEGEVTDLIDVGNHEAGPELMPGLVARRGGWPSPGITADLLFVRTAPSAILRWGTTFPVEVESRRWGTVALRAFGRFSVRLEDPRGVAMRFARMGIPSDDDVDSRLKRMVAGRFAEAMSKLDFGDDDALRGGLEDLDGLTARILPGLKDGLGRSGIKLIRFLIENLTGPLEMGLRPTSRRAEKVTRLGRTLLGADQPPEQVPLVTRAMPRARVGPPPLPPSATVSPSMPTPVAVPVPVPARVDVRASTAPSMPDAPLDDVTPAAALPRVPAVPSTPPPPVTAHAMPDLETVACVACPARIPVHSRFCMQCGTRQTRPCVSCGVDLPAAARFCSHCGTRQP